ncbi:hypothetical protein ACFOU2_21415 [Bacillus songklensis]|uniref:Uncharacterized protein n=1 Tax=Bacillus songklensis TaxID=1069116 RepID=A0ABV8B8T0_9BACI
MKQAQGLDRAKYVGLAIRYGHPIASNRHRDEHKENGKIKSSKPLPHVAGACTFLDKVNIIKEADP